MNTVLIIVAAVIALILLCTGRRRAAAAVALVVAAIQVGMDCLAVAVANDLQQVSVSMWHYDGSEYTNLAAAPVASFVIWGILMVFFFVVTIKVRNKE